MSGQSTIDILMRTKADKSGTNSLKGELGEMKKGLAGAVENMTGLSIASLGTAAAIAGVGKFLADTVQSTMEYAAQVRDLSRVSGASADESSRLIQVVDDLGVEYATLTQAAKKLALEGIALTTEELAKSADEYLAIEDAGLRSQYAVDKFGKAGLELTKVLEQGGDAIRKMAKEQEGGLILTDEQVKKARELEIANDALGDTWRALTTELGMGLIPKLVEFVTWINNVITAGKKTQTQFKEMTTGAATTAKSYDEFRDSMIRQAEAAGLLVGKYGEIRYKGGQIVEGAYILTKEQWEQKKAFEENSIAVKTYGENAQWSSEQGAAPLTTTTKDLTTAQLAEKTAMDLVLGSMKSLTMEMLFQQAAAVLDADSALELGRSMGLIDEKTYGARKAMGQLTDDLANKKITVDQFGQSVRDLGGWVDGLHSKTLTIDVITKHKLLGDPLPPGWTPTPTPYDPKKDPTLPVADATGFFGGGAVGSAAAGAIVINLTGPVSMGTGTDREALARDLAERIRRARG